MGECAPRGKSPLEQQLEWAWSQGAGMLRKDEICKDPEVGTPDWNNLRRRSLGFSQGGAGSRGVLAP
jgi:hypothetical protein